MVAQQKIKDRSALDNCAENGISSTTNSASKLSASSPKSKLAMLKRSSTKAKGLIFKGILVFSINNFI